MCIRDSFKTLRGSGGRLEIWVDDCAILGERRGLHELVIPFDADGFAVPVSYTHLDVYKRQGFGWAVLRTQAPGWLVASYAAAVGLLALFVVGIVVAPPVIGWLRRWSQQRLWQSLLTFVEPVSYTHLDVYKRQATTSVAALFLELGTRRLPAFLPPLLRRFARHPALAARAAQTLAYPFLHPAPAQALSLIHI